MIIEECECHPMGSYGPVKFRKLDYSQAMMAKPFGTGHVILARPHKGFVDHGVYVVAFGYLVFLKTHRGQVKP